MTLPAANRFRDRDACSLEPIEYQAHSHRALADGRRHQLDGSAADVADAEDTGPTRLEQQRAVLNALELRHRNIGFRQHEAILVYGELSRRATRCSEWRR